MLAKAYTLLRDAQTCEKAKQGATVYYCSVARYVGEGHSWVTLNADGSLPGFAVPTADLDIYFRPEVDPLEESLQRYADLEKEVSLLKAELVAAQTKIQKNEDMLDAAARAANAAIKRLETAKAIMHLQRIDPASLSSNAMPLVRVALAEALVTLHKSEADMDRIPF